MLQTQKPSRGFSLLEILVVIAVIGVMLTMAIAYVAGTARAAKQVTARQQQAELQTALGNWIVAESSGSGGLAAARTTYNENAGAKLQLLEDYLQAATYSNLSGDGDIVTSDALDSSNAYLQFSAWNFGQQPALQWINR